MISVQWNRLYIVVVLFLKKNKKLYISKVGFFFDFVSVTITFISSSHPPSTNRENKTQKLNQIQGEKMLPKFIRKAFFVVFSSEADCWLIRGFPVRDVNLERSVVPYPKALARLGPPCACMTLKYIYFFVVHVDQLFENNPLVYTWMVMLIYLKNLMVYK